MALDFVRSLFCLRFDENGKREDGMESLWERWLARLYTVFMMSELAGS